ncbi:hypothetical protein SAMN06296273_2663 [Nitrosomonas ureae]|uniref:Uncharacterized protein n=1 Tax=Nitrosomonas ureae TaxID=44577 RepID=A0A285C2A5_9PROT|nr:hypothetical protein [Nitrosomonas ureae]SNX61208.1 hypothetical protein SAMN06296273_2663 [Nitrosomonas ureae]
MSADLYLTIEEAAFELAKLTFDKECLLADISALGIPETSFENMKEGMIEASQKVFNNQIMSAAKEGELVVRNPANKLPYIPTTRRDFFEVISVTDINAWLEKNGVLYRLPTAISAEIKDYKKELTQSKTNIIAGNESEKEIYILFDTMNKSAIALLFDKVDKLKWKIHFNRAARNGLKEIREAHNKYNPAKIAEWLVNKGYYSREHINRKLAKNLPERSKDKQYLITGDFD